MRSRQKSLDIHTIVNLFHLLRRHAHNGFQPLAQIMADGYIAVNKRPEYLAQKVVFAITTVQIVDIPPVFAVNPPDTRQKECQRLHFQ